MLKIAEPHVLSLKRYVPGRAMENSSAISRWSKLASNENCLGPSPYAIEGARMSLEKAHLYPNAMRMTVIEKICQHLKNFSIGHDQVALGNGSSELIVNLIRGLVSKEEAVMINWPTFVVYPIAANGQGRHVVKVKLKDDMSYDLERMLKLLHDGSPMKVKLIFFSNPNNPTGLYVGDSLFHDFVKGLPEDVVLVIDEAYREYVIEGDFPDCLNYALKRPRTIVLRTFSKVYGLAGLRLGYAIGDPSVIDVLCRIRDPFNVNVVAQHAAISALLDQDHVKCSIEHNLYYRPVLMSGLEDAGFLTTNSVANFVLAKRNEAMPPVAKLCDELMELGVIIRPLDSFGLEDHVRISVGTKGEIEHLFQALKTLGQHAGPAHDL